MPASRTKSKSSRSRRALPESGETRPLAVPPDAAGTLVRALYGAVAYTSYTPLSREDVLERLSSVADALIVAFSTPVYQPAQARGAGAAIVALGFAHPEALGRLETALVEWCLATLPPGQDAAAQERLARIVGDIAAGFATAARDTILAQQEQTRAALLEAERRSQLAEAAMRVRGDVLNAAAHDLRTPVTTIMGRLDLIRVRLKRGVVPAPDWLGEQIDQIRSGAVRINTMVQELLDVAHLQAGQQLELDMGEVDASRLVRDMVRLHDTGTAGSPSLHVDAPDGAVVRGDRMRLERVIDNVLGNAIKYSPGGTPVTVTVRADLDSVTISIADRGVGIPTEELPRLFTPFFRASTARGQAGIGIGLSGAKMIVEQHGGRIDVKSAVGQGTTVTITLPRGTSETLP